MRIQNVAARYALAVLTIAVVTAAELASPQLFAPFRLYPVAIAVALTALFAGFGPALLALTLGNVAVMMMLAPAGSIAVANRNELTGVAIFDVLTLLLIFAVAGHRKLQRESEEMRASHAADVAAAIEHERERLQNIVGSVPGVVWEAWGQPDAASQRIDFVSSHVQRMLGYTVDEWLATPNFWLSIVHPDDRERAARTAAEHFVRGGYGTNSFRWLTKDGRTLSVEGHANVIADEQGQPIGMRGVTMDVSARTRAEQSLRFLTEVSEIVGSSLEYEATLARVAHLAVDRVADCCFIDVLSDDGSITRVTAVHRDPERQRFADVLREHPLTAPPAELSRELTPRSEEEAEALRGAGNGSALVVPLLSHGRNFGGMTFLCSGENAYDDLDADLALLVARRVAAAVENAQLYRAAVEASQAKDEFLATISHELRTPMTATLGWVRLLLISSPDEATQRVAFEAIERSTRAQARLIDDILDVSSIVMGKFRLETTVVELPPVIDAAIDTLRPATEAKNISIDVDTSGWSGIVKGDPSRLQQVVWNLAANAIKFGRRDGRIEVRLRRDGDLARLTVSDDGAGIDPKVLPHVFERFRQGESGMSRTYGGLGLGLAIVRHLVELHGGRVRAMSEGAGKGATFTVELPIAEETAVAEPRRPMAQPAV